MAERKDFKPNKKAKTPGKKRGKERKYRPRKESRRGERKCQERFLIGKRKSHRGKVAFRGGEWRATDKLGRDLRGEVPEWKGQVPVWYD